MWRTGNSRFAVIVGLALTAAACSGTRDGAVAATTAPASSVEPESGAPVDDTPADSASDQSTLAKIEPSEAENSEGTMRFDSDPTAAAAPGWAPIIGEWSVEDDPTAPSPPNVYAQLGTSNLAPPPEAAGDLFGSDYFEYLDNIDAYEIFPATLMAEGTFADVDVTVSYKPVSGNIDQSGGIIVRAKGPADYYIFRCNVLEGDCRLWTYVDGDRSSVYSAKVGGQNTGEWQTLRVRVEGNHFLGWWNDREVMDFTDDTIGGAGQVGLWTKADAVTYFDDFSAVEL